MIFNKNYIRVCENQTELKFYRSVPIRPTWKFQSPGIIESILECGLLMTRLISPTPALNSHQGQPRNKIRVKIDFEKEQERLEHVEIAKFRQISGATRF